jgi:hypothetical protein
MLESRNIKATLSGETLGAAAVRGCPQGVVLSPLLWSLVVDDLLWELNPFRSTVFGKIAAARSSRGF